MRMLLLTIVIVVVSSVILVQVRKVLGQNIVKEPTTAPSNNSGVLNLTVKDIEGKDVNLADYRGKVVMIVNVASKCGLTPQYEGLEKIYDQYKDRGFIILGFPANNFNGQEPGTNEQIKEFCSSKFDVSFPMMSKISVKGDDIHPLYKTLTTNGEFSGDIGWNFTKFLVDKNGNVYARFASRTKPDDAAVVEAIEKGLK